MNEDQAKQRFILMNVARLAGIGLALFGLAILAGKLDVPRAVGGFFFVAGLFEALFLPTILAKRWKSPPP